METNNNLIEIVKAECNDVYLATLCPLIRKFGIVHLGVAEYFTWLTNDNIEEAKQKGFYVGDKEVIEEATDDELVKMLGYAFLFKKFYNSNEFNENIGWIKDLMER